MDETLGFCIEGPWVQILVVAVMPQACGNALSPLSRTLKMTSSRYSHRVLMDSPLTFLDLQPLVPVKDC